MSSHFSRLPFPARSSLRWAYMPAETVAFLAGSRESRKLDATLWANLRRECDRKTHAFTERLPMLTAGNLPNLIRVQVFVPVILGWLEYIDFFLPIIYLAYHQQLIMTCRFW